MSGKPVLTARAMNANFTSTPQNIGGLTGYSVQCVFTGTTIAGTITLEASTNFATGTAETWDAIPGASHTPSAAGSVTFNLYSQYYPFFRVKWVDAGTSSANSLMTVTSYVKD